MHFIPFGKKNLSTMILTSLSPSAVPCIESLPVVLLCCGSGGCVDMPSLLLFVAVVGCVSALVFFSVISCCSGGGCINVSSALVFVDIGGCNSTGLEAVPVFVMAMGVPIVVLAMESPDVLLPFVVAAGVVVLPFLLFVSGCGSGGCIDVPSSPLLFVDIVGFVSAGVDGNALMLFVFVISGCGGGGCIDVSLTLVFIDVGGCNSAGLEAVPIIAVAMGVPVVFLAMEPPDALLPFIVAAHCGFVAMAVPVILAMEAPIVILAMEPPLPFLVFVMPDGNALLPFPFIISLHLNAVS
jgi:hypothetical protein